MDLRTSRRPSCFLPLLLVGASPMLFAAPVVDELLEQPVPCVEGNYYNSRYFRGGFSYYKKGPIYRYAFLHSPFYTPYVPFTPGIQKTVVKVLDPQRHLEADVQRALQVRGYYKGFIDGNVGAKTRAAIRAYQMDRKLPVTGTIDGTLLASLRLL